MFAKRFFYVSAGVFLLALSYHLGARSARAQGATVTVGDADYAGNEIAAVVGRTVYWNNFEDPPVVRPAVPGTSDIVAVGANYSSGHVLLANGDCYRSEQAGDWVFLGNFLGGPTSASQSSWGKVKTVYR